METHFPREYSQAYLSLRVYCKLTCSHCQEAPEQGYISSLRHRFMHSNSKPRRKRNAPRRARFL